MEQVKGIWNKIVEKWKSLNKKIKLVIIAAASVLLVAVLVFAFLGSKTNYVTLFSGLDSSELTEVLTKLQEKNINYQYNSSGQVLVPENQETTLRMQLAQEGYPKTGLNYTVFTSNIGFMSTDFEKQKYAIFQLQERLQATIATIPGVSNVEVTLDVPEQDNFAWDENANEPTGHVKVNMKSGYALNDSQVAGISKLVEKSVSGLKEENIAIIDTDGNLISGTDSLDSFETNTLMLKIQVERSLESELESKIKAFLEKPYGSKNVEVMVKCTYNFDNTITENLNYIPSEEGANSGVISEKNNGIEVVGEGDVTAGAVGEDSNAEIPSYPEVTVDGDNIYYKDSSSINYLVSQIKEQVQHEPGYLEDVVISVIVNKDSMVDTEIENMKKLVANAADVSVENVAFSYYKFYTPIVEVFDNEGNFLDLTDQQMLYAAIAAGGLLLLIIIIIVLLSKRRKKKKAKEAEALLAGTSFVNADGGISKGGKGENLPGEIKPAETKSQAYKKQITDFSLNNPEIVAQLIRTWLKGDDE